MKPDPHAEYVAVTFDSKAGPNQDMGFSVDVSWALKVCDGGGPNVPVVFFVKRDEVDSIPRNLARTKRRNDGDQRG